jgi:hypothetical protein
MQARCGLFVFALLVWVVSGCAHPGAQTVSASPTRSHMVATTTPPALMPWPASVSLSTSEQRS